tara:strand:- start:758 stop:1000 length:243 start_codon:yes stop_codon:yes gene_type:complete
MDKRKNNTGTLGNKGGRPPKAEEMVLVERLSPLDDEALEQLKIAINQGKPWAVKLFFEYRYGKPKETKDITLNTEQPLFL